MLFQTGTRFHFASELSDQQDTAGFFSDVTQPLHFYESATGLAEIY